MCACSLFCFVFIFFFEERYFIFKVSVVKQVKFRRDSNCLASDEFLVIFKGGHILTCMYIFANCVIVGHCIALHNAVCVRYFLFLNLL